MPLRLISFDAVGTLIRVREPVSHTYAMKAAAHGVRVAESALQKSFAEAWAAMPAPLHPEAQAAADDDRSWWSDLVGRVFASALNAPLPGEVFTLLFADIYAHYEKPQAWEVYDDVMPALQNLSGDHTLCVLSNFDRRLRTILAGHGLAEFFNAIIVSSEVGASKPHPRMFAAALALVGGRAGDCLHAGDDLELDVRGAQAAGWRAFAVSRPGSGLDELVGKLRAGAYSGLHVA